MHFFRMPSQDIRMNLATEEYLMNHVSLEEPTLLLYIQAPCVIIGRNQNAYGEIDFNYLKTHEITLTRRTSGGGAVYDDLGNLSFSFVTEKNRRDFGDYAGATAPIVAALQRMGARQVEVAGRNDLYIEGKKFSGNAMYTKNNRTYSHGTLMYDVDLSVLEEVLKVDPEKIASKATKSVRKSVTNLKPYLKKAFQFEKTEDFRDALIAEIFSVQTLSEIVEQELQLTSDDQAAIQKLFEERYANEAWIFGEAPAYEMVKRTRVPSVGIVAIHLSIVAGKISQCQILGDFFGEAPIEALTEKLIGVTYQETSVAKVLENISVGDYIHNFSNLAFLETLFS